MQPLYLAFWQALKYVSYCATLTKTEIYEIYQRYLGSKGIASEKISEFYDEQDHESIGLNSAEGEQRIILVAGNFRKEVTSTVLWLRNYHGVDISCIKVTPYKDGEKLYLDTEQIIPIQDIGDYQIRLTNKNKRRQFHLRKMRPAIKHDIVSGKRPCRPYETKPHGHIFHYIEKILQGI